jgi:mycofactocin system glycosyltransferase
VKRNPLTRLTAIQPRDSVEVRAIPRDWSIRMDPSARRTDGGKVLIGGSPLRILRLSAAGARWLDAVVAGDPLPASPPSRRLAGRLIDAGLALPRPSHTDSISRDDVALVVPVRDAPKGLARTLASVGHVGECVVIDDGSRHAAAVRSAAPRATVLRHPRPLGPAAARQRGWRATTKPIVAFVDADVEAGDDWLAPLLDHFGDPAVGAVAPRILTSGGTTSQLLARYEAARSPLDLGPLAGPVRPGSRVPYVPTATLVVRRTALESINGFDPQLQVGEDVDLVWRLHARGWRVRYEASVALCHPARPDLGAWVRQRVRYGTSAAPLGRRHDGAVAPLDTSGWSTLAWALFLFGRPVLAASVGATTTAALVPKLRLLEHPVVEAVRLAGLGNLNAGRAMGDALRRSWWPLAFLLAVCARRTRRALLAAVIVPPLLEWHERRPDLDPLRFTLLRVVDDFAYGAGVWVGCARERSFRSLLPSFSGPLEAPQPDGDPAVGADLAGPANKLALAALPSSTLGKAPLQLPRRRAR